MQRQFEDQSLGHWAKTVENKHKFVCARCRLKHLDPFFPVRKAVTPTFFVELNQAGRGEANITFSGTTLQNCLREYPRSLIHLRCVRLDDWYPPLLN